MSVKIRLALTGKKHQISYRLVAQDTRSKRDGKFLEILGYFNPSEKDKNRTFVDKDKIKFWVAKGATFSESAKHLIEKGELPPKPKKKVEPKKETAPKLTEVAGEAYQPTAENTPLEPATEEAAVPAETSAPEAPANPIPAKSEEIKQDEVKPEEK
jgi:small subunit ribosomal protein S16